MTGLSTNGTAKLNYNLYFGQMDLTDKKGDTIQIKTSRKLKLIEIDGHLFYHDARKGYIEIIIHAPVALGAWTILSTERMEYVSGNISGSKNVDARGLPSVYDRYYKKKVTYFFVDQRNKLHRAVKPSLLKLFPEYKTDIIDYVAENQIDFNRKEDLAMLINFCNGFKPPSEHDLSEFFRVEAGQSMKAMWYDSIYRFSNFHEASIVFRNGAAQHYESRLNYNYYSGEMDVINKNGDTVKIKDPLNIKTVAIDGCLFYHDYNEGYIEILLHCPLSLGVNRTLEMKLEQKSSDNGKVSMTGKSFHRTNDVTNYGRLFKQESRYFFIDQKNRLYPASKLSIQKLYPKKKATVSAYIRENNIDFKSEEDLMKLTSYCSQFAAFK